VAARPIGPALASARRRPADATRRTARDSTARRGGPGRR
jgi:hypothetical protein